MSPSPLGIFGGIFDPVHNGHLSVAALAIEYFKLQKLIVVPSGLPPHKDDTVYAAAQHRLNMLEIALKSLNKAYVWDGELERDGFSYTVDTLAALQQQYGSRQFYFLIGSDNLSQICSWKNYQKIVQMVTFCVASRPGFDTEIPPELSKADIKLFPSPEWGLSSSAVRSFFEQGYSCKYLIPDEVLIYIRRNKLYATY